MDVWNVHATPVANNFLGVLEGPSMHTWMTRLSTPSHLQSFVAQSIQDIKLYVLYACTALVHYSLARYTLPMLPLPCLPGKAAYACMQGSFHG